MKADQKNTKTFPLEIDEGLHRSLKIKAIEEGKTLHSLIIDMLATRVAEPGAEYFVKVPKTQTKEGES